MRITFVSHSSELAGAERSLLAVAPAAVARLHQVEVWLPGQGPLWDALDQVGGIRLRSLSNHWWMSRRGGGVVGLIRLVQAGVDLLAFVQQMRRSKPDVVVVNSSVTPAPMCAAHALGIPCVTVVRESIRSNPTLRTALPKTLVLRLIAHWSDTVVAVSRYVAGQVERPCTVVTPSITGHGAPQLRSVPPRERPPGQVNLVMLGTIGGDKNQLDAVTAVALARERGADIRLDMFGHGPQRDIDRVNRLAGMLHVAGEVRVHPPQKDVRGILGSADATVMCSLNEAFGRVTVESLLLGVPVVGYDAGGTSEILANGGGALVQPNPRALAEELVKIASDERYLADMTADACEAGSRWSRLRSEERLLDVVEESARRRR